MRISLMCAAGASFWLASSTVSVHALDRLSNDLCESAVTVGVEDYGGTLLGATNDGSASVGERGRPDVWYTFIAEANGLLTVSTCGSHDLPGRDEGIDTVLSLHSSCPGSIRNELASNDNSSLCESSEPEFLFDSAVSFRMERQERVSIRVSMNGEEPGPFLLQVRFTQEGARITSVTPNLISSEGGSAISVQGENLQPDHVILIGTTELVSQEFVSSQQITGVAPPLEEGRYAVKLSLGGAVVSELSDAVEAAPPPGIEGVEPREVSRDGGTPVTVYGAHFRETTVIRIGDLPLASAVFISSSRIQGIAPSLSPEAPAGPRDVVAEDSRGRAVLHGGISYIGPAVDTPPMTLHMGTFVLRVIAYDDYAWDPRGGGFSHAAGDAYTTLSCERPISDNIRVRFENLTIEDSGTAGVGRVTEGRATYPTRPEEPASLSTVIEGFTVFYGGLEILPTAASADILVRFPPGLTGAAGCGPPELPIGRVAISATSACDFYVELPRVAFGPWVVGETGIEIRGGGVTVDLSTRWSPATTRVPLSSAWRGVMLGAGTTSATATGTMVSNTGYLKAPYSFVEALITAPGLQARLVLASAFEFRTTQPLGYRVLLNTGELDLTGSAVTGGQFRNGTILLPGSAVLNLQGQPLSAKYATLAVQSDLDLYASVSVAQDLFWGHLTSSLQLKAFAVAREGATGTFDGHVYFAAAFKAPYFPLNSAGDFLTPSFGSDMAGALESQSMQGFTTRFVYQGTSRMQCAIYTPDKDTPNVPILGVLDLKESWLNVGAQGVHGRMNFMEMLQTPTLLGPTSAAYYEADSEGTKAPFETRFAHAQGIDGWLEMLDLKFVDSAVFESTGNGNVDLDKPTDAELPITDVHVTSTAHLPGAEMTIRNPIKLDYWQVELVQKPESSSAGVVSFKTGEIFLTGAGIRETNHFAQPFYLLWGVVHASGSWGEPLLDLNCAGQQFDGFTYVPEVFLLSSYIASDTQRTNAYIQVAGNINFDYFGATYLNIIDRYTNSAAYPYHNRRIELSDTALPAKAINASDLDISRDWGIQSQSLDKFGEMQFQIRYNDTAQDGFVGTGTSTLHFIANSLAATITLNRARICFSIVDPSPHEFSLGSVANFGAMRMATGCGCIKDGSLERIILAAELDQSVDVSVLLRQGGYASIESIITPAATSIEISGLMFLNLLSAADLQVTGSIKLIESFAEDYVEAEISGKIDATTLLQSTLEASGKLNWHLGVNEQWIQGRLGMQIMSVACAGGEGGFFAGHNTPTTNIWVFADEDQRFALDTRTFPGRITGIYGYLEYSAGLNIVVLSGGYEMFVGAGAFVQTVSGSGGSVGGPLPFCVGHMGIHVYGKILAGLVSAGAWGHLQMQLPVPYFKGTVGLEACVLWVMCGSVDVSVGLSDDGFYID